MVSKQGSISNQTSKWMTYSSSLGIEVMVHGGEYHMVSSKTQEERHLSMGGDISLDDLHIKKKSLFWIWVVNVFVFWG